MQTAVRFLSPLLATLMGIMCCAAAWAIDEREEILVGRIAHIEGDLMRYVEETKDWTLTVKDAPFGLEDALYSGDNAKAEVILPNETWMRIGEDTQVQMIDLNADATTVDVASGLARLYNRSRDVVIKATTPFGYVVAPAGSAFDLYVGDESLEVIAVRGEVDFVHEASGTQYPVRQGSNSIIADRQTTTQGNGAVDGPWDDWNNQRESTWAQRQQSRTSSANLLPAPIRENAYTLEESGRWERVYYDGDYRDLWRPTRVDTGWRPFTNGRWVDYYGDNCWIPSESFGYVTHHYGSWVYVDAFNAWYWMPPVPRRSVHRPGLTISFGWYPGRVGWFQHGRDIGWVPLAPNEDYYGYRHWGHRTKVIRDHAPMMNLSRYHYLNHASIIDRDHLYHGDRYAKNIRRDVNKTVIINDYKPVATWNDFRQDKRRYNFADREISRKPHADTVERIRDNDRRRKEIGRMDRGRIERDLQQVKVGRDMPTRTDIRSPITTSKIVDADKRSTPLDRGSLPTREFKPKERERTISTDSRPGFDANSAIERRPEGSDRFNRRPPTEEEGKQHLRSPRDRQIQETGNREPGDSSPQEMRRGPRDPRELRRSREGQQSTEGASPALSREQEMQGRGSRELTGKGEEDQLRQRRPTKAESEGAISDRSGTDRRDRLHRPGSEGQSETLQGREPGDRQRIDGAKQQRLPQEDAQRSQPEFDRRQRHQQEQQQQVEQAEQRRRQADERLQQQREQAQQETQRQDIQKRRQEEGLRRQQEQDRASQTEIREQEGLRERQKQLRRQQDAQQEVQSRQQREKDDRLQQLRSQEEGERRQQEAQRNRQVEEQQQEIQRRQQQEVQREQQQQEVQRRQQQEAQREQQQQMRRQQEQQQEVQRRQQQEAEREQQQQMRRQQQEQQQEIQRRQQQEAQREQQQQMRRQQQEQQQQEMQRRQQEAQQQEIQRRQQQQEAQRQQQEAQRKKRPLTPEEQQQLNQGN